jgi:hypothetical protein
VLDNGAHCWSSGVGVHLETMKGFCGVYSWVSMAGVLFQSCTTGCEGVLFQSHTCRLYTTTYMYTGTTHLPLTTTPQRYIHIYYIYYDDTFIYVPGTYMSYKYEAGYPECVPKKNNSTVHSTCYNSLYYLYINIFF